MDRGHYGGGCGHTSPCSWQLPNFWLAGAPKPGWAAMGMINMAHTVSLAAKATTYSCSGVASVLLPSQLPPSQLPSMRIGLGCHRAAAG